jgi:hypothetical protein
MSTTSEELKDGVTRRDFLTLVGTAARSTARQCSTAGKHDEGGRRP